MTSEATELKYPMVASLAGCGKTLRSTQDSKRVDDKRRHIALPAPIALNKL